MSDFPLTERQQREREYYEEFSRRYAPAGVSFDPILGHERRPWNPYWFLCEVVMNNFRSGEQKLLDFGCGTGLYSLIFAKVGYRVDGCDISPNNVSIAQRLAEENALAGAARFDIGLAEGLDYPSEHFDVVVGIDILHHVDLRRAVVECLRVLRKGGIAVFKEPVEVPIFDPLRNTKFGRWLVPKSASFEQSITEDERKLNGDDLKFIREACPDFSVKRFRLFSRIDAFNKKLMTGKKPSTVEKIDERIFSLLPFMKTYGGDVVMTLRK